MKKQRWNEMAISSVSYDVNEGEHPFLPVMTPKIEIILCNRPVCASKAYLDAKGETRFTKRRFKQHDAQINLNKRLQVL
jgi:hypothetical protein